MISQDQLGKFRSYLIRGEYNLLFGAGISLGSKNGDDAPVESANALQTRLCKYKSLRENTPLTRVYRLLTEEEIDEQITRPFSNCRGEETLRKLTNYLWRRAFTFNIDDVIEHTYESSNTRKQELQSLNFDAPFEPTPYGETLQIIHLHGSVRHPNAGYVFANSEYAQSLRGPNPWMTMLGQIISTESFIIAGTSLNEVDLEFYLSKRTKSSTRRDRGPSLLIEPHPDVATESDCERFNLTLVRGTFSDFLHWLMSEIPHPPTIEQLLVPDVKSVFSDQAYPANLARFFSDFSVVAPVQAAPSKNPTGFFSVGHRPRKISHSTTTFVERVATPC